MIPKSEEEEKSDITKTSPEEAKILLNHPHPCQTWAILQRKFKSTNATQHRFLVQALVDLKLESPEAFERYAASMEETFARLAVMGDSFSDKLKRAFLLTGLPRDADSIFAVIDADADMDYDTVRATLLSFFEQHHLRQDNNKTGAMRGAVTPAAGKQQKQKQEQLCKHCVSKHRKANHKIEECWLLHPEKKIAFLQKQLADLQGVDDHVQANTASVKHNWEHFPSDDEDGGITVM